MQRLSFRLALLAITFPLCCARAAAPDVLSDPLGTIPGDGRTARSQLAPTATGAVAPAKQAVIAMPTPSAPPVVVPAASTPALPAATQARQSSVQPATEPRTTTPRPISAPTSTSQLASTASAPSFAAATQSTTLPQRGATRDVATLRQLDALRSEIAVLGQMVKAAELRAKLPASQAPAQAPAPRVSESERSSQAVQALQVVSVYGVDGRLTAVLQFPSGGVVKVQAGSVLPGVGRVTTVAHNQVSVATAGGQYALSFAPITAVEQ